MIVSNSSSAVLPVLLLLPQHTAFSITSLYCGRFAAADMKDGFVVALVGLESIFQKLYQEEFQQKLTQGYHLIKMWERQKGFKNYQLWFHNFSYIFFFRFYPPRSSCICKSHIVLYYSIFFGVIKSTRRISTSELLPPKVEIMGSNNQLI